MRVNVCMYTFKNPCGSLEKEDNLVHNFQYQILVCIVFEATRFSYYAAISELRNCEKNTYFRLRN